MDDLHIACNTILRWYALAHTAVGEHLLRKVWWWSTAAQHSDFWESARQSYHCFLHKDASRLFCVSFFDHVILLVSVLCQQSVVTPANLPHTAKPNIVDSITMYWRRPLRKTGEPKLPEAAGFSRLLNGGCITSLSWEQDRGVRWSCCSCYCDCSG